MARPTIFDFVGGDPAFRALAAELHERCLQDPVLNHPFSHASDPAHLEHLATYLAEVFGGPARYSGSLGGHSGMLQIHAGQGAGEDYGTRFAACFTQAVDDASSRTTPSSGRSSARSSTPRLRRSCRTRPATPWCRRGQPLPRWSWSGPVS
jgi:hemoglobin